jgi:hypothetical protein
MLVMNEKTHHVSVDADADDDGNDDADDNE